MKKTERPTEQMITRYRSWLSGEDRLSISLWRLTGNTIHRMTSLLYNLSQVFRLNCLIQLIFRITYYPASVWVLHYRSQGNGNNEQPRNSRNKNWLIEQEQDSGIELRQCKFKLRFRWCSITAVPIISEIKSHVYGNGKRQIQVENLSE